MTEIETDYEEVEIEEARTKPAPPEQQTGAYIMVVCAHCGKLFAARRRRKARRRYCSAACCSAAWRKAGLEAQTCKSAPVYLTVRQLLADQKLRAAHRKAALRKADQLNAHNNVTITRRRNAEGLFVETRGRACGSAGCNRSWQFSPYRATS